MPRQTVKVNLYVLVEEKIEVGLRRGWARVHKYHATPTPEQIQAEQLECVMLELAEAIDFR